MSPTPESVCAPFATAAADAIVHRDVFVDAQHILHRIIGIAVCRDEVDGDVGCCGVFEEIVHPVGGGGCGAADAQSRTHCFQSACGVVVQVEVAGLSGDAVPEIDVGFVPDFEVPLRYFVDSIAIYEVLGEVRHQIVPAFHALWRRDVRLVPERMECVRVEGQLLWHEADLYDGAHAILQQAVVDLIDVGEIVDGIAVLVFVVDAYLVVKDGVEANVAEVRYFLHGAKIFAVAFTQSQDGAPGAEHLFPEVGEGSGLGVGVDLDGLLGRGLE